jgi:O-methyltransferase
MIRLPRPVRQLIRAVAEPLTAQLYANRPIESWPPILGVLHEISVPRGVIPHPEPLPVGEANINNLIHMLEQTRGVPGDIAECGVFRGASLVPMALYARQTGLAKRFYGFDSFEGFAHSVTVDRELGGTHPEWKNPGVMSNTSYETVAAKVRRFALENVELAKGYFDQTFPRFAGHTFSFVHLDCDAYQAYRECLEFFYPRLSPGGAILFDEYNDPPWPGCNKAVDEFLAGRPERLEFIAKDNWIKYYFVKRAATAAV